MGTLVQKLISQIKSDKAGTKSTALAALSALAGTSKTFTQHYDQIMPVLRHEIEQNPTDELLRDRLYECAGIIIKESGKEKAEPDIAWYMDALLKQKRNDMIQYSFTRVIQCIGKDFHKYSAQVIPMIMEDITTYRPSEINPIDILDGDEIKFKADVSERGSEFATSVMKELLDVVPEDCKDCLPALITTVLGNINESDSLHYYTGYMEIAPTLMKCIKEGGFTEQEKDMYLAHFINAAVTAMTEQGNLNLTETCIYTVVDLLQLDVENKYDRSLLVNPLYAKFHQMISYATRPPFDDEEADEDEEEDEQQLEDVRVFITLTNFVAKERTISTL